MNQLLGLSVIQKTNKKKMNTFEVAYDDQLWDVVNRISACLEKHGLTIEDITPEGSDIPVSTYRIKRLDTLV